MRTPEAANAAEPGHLFTIAPAELRKTFLQWREAVS
jgi:hypothetical protein